MRPGSTFDLVAFVNNQESQLEIGEYDQQILTLNDCTTDNLEDGRTQYRYSFTANSAGETDVVLSCTESENFTSESITVPIKVLPPKGQPEINCEPIGEQIQNGSTFDLVAFVNNQESQLEIEEYDQQILTLNNYTSENVGDGKQYRYSFTANGAGETEVALSCTESENYTSASITVPIEVVDNSGIGRVDNGCIKVAGKRGIITIKGVRDNEIAEVFNSNGIRIYSGVGRNIAVPIDRIYMVLISEQIFKVSVH